MDNKKKIIFGLIAGIIFIIAFILNLLFPPEPFIKSAHAIGYTGSFVITSGSLNQTIAEHDAALYDWLEGQGAVDENYTYNDFLLDLASAYIGSKTGINDNLIDAAIDGLYDVLLDQAFSWDSTSGFIAYPNTADSFLNDFKHDHGYNYSGPVVGGWYECPYNTDTYFQSNYLRYLDFVEGPNASAPVYVCFYTGSQSGNHYVVFASFVSGQDARVNQYYSNNDGNTWQYSYAGYSLTSTYQGSELLGYYQTVNLNFFNAPYTLFPFYSEYGNQNDALADLFGWDGSTDSGDGEGVFNGNVYFDYSSTPINLLDVPGNDGRARSIQRNTDINNNIVNNYGGYNDIVLSPKLEDIPNNHEYELPVYPEIPHDLPAVTFEYPEIVANEEISEGLDGLSPLWVTLLTMGGSFIVLKVIL